MIQKTITQKELDYRWEFTPEQNWEQAPQYPIKLIRAGQREFYSVSKFNFEIKDFWLFIFLPFLPELLFACFESLNKYLEIVDLSNKTLVGNAEFNRQLYYSIHASVMLLQVIVKIVALFYLSFKYKKQFYISGVAFYFIYNMLEYAVSSISLIIEGIFTPFITVLGGNFAKNIVQYVQIYSGLVIYLVFCLVFIFTVKDVRRGWKLLFQLRTNLYTNRMLNHLPRVIGIHKNNKPYSYRWTRLTHWIEKNQIKKMLMTYLIIFITAIFVIVANLIGDQISKIFKFPNNNQNNINNKLKNFDWVKTIPYLILVVLGSPVIEEFIFRCGIMNMTNRNWLSLFTSATIFALAHDAGSGILVLWPYFGAGLVFSFSYRLTGNIWFTVAAHFLNNFISTISKFI